MGNLLNCSECPPASRSTVFTFSEPLVLKITEGIEPEPEPKKEGQAQDLNDREWMDKILCIDNAHTQAYGLTQSGFNGILGHIERMLHISSHRDFGQEKVKKCYRQFTGETIQCSEDVKEFIDAVDVHRLRTVKEKFSGSERK